MPGCVVCKWRAAGVSRLMIRCRAFPLEEALTSHVGWGLPQRVLCSSASQLCTPKLIPRPLLALPMLEFRLQATGAEVSCEARRLGSQRTIDPNVRRRLPADDQMPCFPSKRSPNESLSVFHEGQKTAGPEVSCQTLPSDRGMAFEEEMRNLMPCRGGRVLNESPLRTTGTKTAVAAISEPRSPG